MNEERRVQKMVLDDRIEELIRRKFRNCVTGSLFDRPSCPTTAEWFSQAPTGRQLHLLEVRQAKR